MPPSNTTSADDREIEQARPLLVSGALPGAALVALQRPSADFSSGAIHPKNDDADDSTPLLPEQQKKKGSRGGQPKIKTTSPDEILLHKISDDQLERLMEGSQKEGQSGAFWALFGAALAALPSVGETLWNAYLAKPGIPISIGHQVELIIACILIGGAAMRYKRKDDCKDKVAELAIEIRARNKR